MLKLKLRFKGGPGSGHRGHAGRPGSVGGSLPGGVGVSGASKQGWSKDFFGQLTKKIGDRKAIIRSPDKYRKRYDLHMSKSGVEYNRRVGEAGILHNTEESALTLANEFLAGKGDFITYQEKLSGMGT